MHIMRLDACEKTREHTHTQRKTHILWAFTHSVQILVCDMSEHNLHAPRRHWNKHVLIQCISYENTQGFWIVSSHRKIQTKRDWETDLVENACYSVMFLFRKIIFFWSIEVFPILMLWIYKTNLIPKILHRSIILLKCRVFSPSWPALFLHNRGQNLHREFSLTVKGHTRTVT